jgi:hypothetical protein
MVNLGSVAFRNLVVEYEELSSVLHDSDFGSKWDELISRWRLQMPGNSVRRRIFRDGIISMNFEKHQELTLYREKECRTEHTGSDDEDVNKVERDVQNIELRV